MRQLAQKKAKKTARDRGFQGWNDVAVWRDFKPIYIPEDIWPHYLEHVTSEQFTRRSQSGAGNRNRPIHGGAASLGHEPSPMELFVETHVRSQDRQKGAQQFVDNRASHFVETYNNRLRERYGDDILTHPEFDPDLWMEVGSSGGPDKNRVYGLSNTTADNLRSTCSVSTVGSSQSISSSQSKEFVALQQHTAQLTEKYDHLSAEYA